ncbi:MAG: 50S ribosomal protein L16 3-hydroxylase [Candidatus Azotimanducaceae bacterium]
MTNLLNDDFQQKYWRKAATSPGTVDIQSLEQLTLEALQLLAEDDQVESRVIEDLDGSYDLFLGPFERGELGPNQMLMVQNLESFLPAVSDWLSREFAFLPRWRIEDVMASASHQNGNCGPHFDQYDVFLVQLQGQKHWSLDDGQHVLDDLRPDSDVRLLADFQATHTTVQKPGDVLYIPPGVGHHGIASDNCITLSVGIRNPLLSEMASYLADLLLQEGSEGESLNDRLYGAEIDPVEVENLGQQLAAALTEPSLMGRWYGCYMTEPRDPDLITYPEQEMTNAQVTDWLKAESEIRLELSSRIAVQGKQLFINGEMFQLLQPSTWLTDLQQQRFVSPRQIQPKDIDTVTALIHAGAVVPFLS